MLEKYLSVPSLHFIKYTEFALFNAVVNSLFPPYIHMQSTAYIVSHGSPIKKKPRWYDSSPLSLLISLSSPDRVQRQQIMEESRPKNKVIKAE